jgi:predicted transcriptional regulator with HTH domain
MNGEQDQVQSLLAKVAEVKSENSKLSEENRTIKADLEAAKGRISFLQYRYRAKKCFYEDTLTALQCEIETLKRYCNISDDDDGEIFSYKKKYDKLTRRTNELQKLYDDSVAANQRMRYEIRAANGKMGLLKEENERLRHESEERRKIIVYLRKAHLEYRKSLPAAGQNPDQSPEQSPEPGPEQLTAEESKSEKFVQQISSSSESSEVLEVDVMSAREDSMPESDVSMTQQPSWLKNTKYQCKKCGKRNLKSLAGLRAHERWAHERWERKSLELNGAGN